MGDILGAMQPLWHYLKSAVVPQHFPTFADLLPERIPSSQWECYLVALILIASSSVFIVNALRRSRV